MWERSELKRRAKAAVRKNYLVCMLAALILLFTAGSQVTDKEELVQDASSTYYAGLMLTEDAELEEIMMPEEEAGGIYQTASDVMNDPYVRFVKRVVMGPMQVIWDNIVWILGGAGPVVLMLLGIFAFNPVEVGGCRFFADNERAGSNRMEELKKLIFVFRDKSYRNVVLTMFIRSLKIMLWSLLLVVPGVIKAYEYRMVPYLLSEQPGMDRREALERSAQMMDGQKWKAFVLDFSFILWDYLAIITFGLAGIFFVYPYEHATNAELYLELKREEKRQEEACTI